MKKLKLELWNEWFGSQLILEVVIYFHFTKVENVGGVRFKIKISSLLGFFIVSFVTHHALYCLCNLMFIHADV